MEGVGGHGTDPNRAAHPPRRLLARWPSPPRPGRHYNAALLPLPPSTLTPFATCHLPPCTCAWPRRTAPRARLSAPRHMTFLERPGSARLGRTVATNKAGPGQAESQAWPAVAGRALARSWPGAGPAWGFGQAWQGWGPRSRAVAAPSDTPSCCPLPLGCTRYNHVTVRDHYFETTQLHRISVAVAWSPPCAVAVSDSCAVTVRGERPRVVTQDMLVKSRDDDAPPTRRSSGPEWPQAAQGDVGDARGLHLP